jgi:hypothetical protein
MTDASEDTQKPFQLSFRGRYWTDVEGKRIVQPKGLLW